MQEAECMREKQDTLCSQPGGPLDGDCKSWDGPHLLMSSKAVQAPGLRLAETGMSQ